MNLRYRSYQNEADYWRIRNFLRDVFMQNDRRMFCWPVARLDYWRWHGILNMGDGTLETGVYLWETQDGQIAGVLNREGAGQAFLQIHPAFKTPDLEEQMIALAEENLRAASRRGDQVCGFGQIQRMPNGMPRWKAGDISPSLKPASTNGGATWSCPSRISR